MNFWTPQTGKMGDGWQYTYTANKIRGFKQTHQPSPWINDYGQFSLITRLGMLIFLVSIGMLIYSVVRHFMGATTTGWTSLIVSIWAIGGLQLLAIGVIGQYIGKVYLETKERPKYIVETYLSDENENSKEE